VEAGYGFVRFGEYMKIQESRTKSQVEAKNPESSLPAEGLPKAEAKNQVRVQGAELSAQEDTTHHSSLITHHSSLVILRHDVDRLPENSLRTAKIEHDLGIRGSYYFRIVQESFDEEVIKKIAALGHEVGYHYEDVDLAARLIQGKRQSAAPPPDVGAMADKEGKSERVKSQDPGTGSLKKEEENLNSSLITLRSSLYQTALQLFEQHLTKLRALVPVETICMHGSPRSKYDNKSLWEHYDYRDYGIIGEPYFDVDFTEVLYLTDTGRRWDGMKVSVRDKISEDSRYKNQEPSNIERREVRDERREMRNEKRAKRNERREVRSEREYLNADTKYIFRSTDDIIRAAEQGRLPEQIMITIHPQRWTDEPVAWMKELVWQNVKNQVKRVLVKW